MNFKIEKQELIYWAKALNHKGLVTAKNGNISCKVSDNKILITTHNAYLGHLGEREIILSDSEGNILDGELEMTSEKVLHLGIHQSFNETKVVFHAHSPYTTAFFHYFENLEIFSFEGQFYLGNIKAIPQDGPAVTVMEPVLRALEDSNIVVLKNHGVVAVGEDFKKAFGLIEILEEQAKVNLLLRAGRFSQHAASHQSSVDNMQASKNAVSQSFQKKYKLLSEEHITQLVEVINGDKEVQDLGVKYELTCTLAVKNQDTGDVVCFYYDKGRIVKADSNENAEFVIIGRGEILKRVFNREIDPFVASTQGKVKTKGDFTKMSRWYPVLVKTFKLWEKAPVE